MILTINHYLPKAALPIGSTQFGEMKWQSGKSSCINGARLIRSLPSEPSPSSILKAIQGFLLSQLLQLEALLERPRH